MFTLIFWKATAERAVKSFAQALAAVLGAGGVAAQHVDWTMSLTVAGMTALLSVLTSLASVKVGDVGMPSLVSRDSSEPAPASSAAEPQLART